MIRSCEFSVNRLTDHHAAEAFCAFLNRFCRAGMHQRNLKQLFEGQSRSNRDRYKVDNFSSLVADDVHSHNLPGLSLEQYLQHGLGWINRGPFVIRDESERLTVSDHVKPSPACFIFVPADRSCPGIRMDTSWNPSSGKTAVLTQDRIHRNASLSYRGAIQ